MLNRKNLCTMRPMEKLDHKMVGPFVVLRKIGSRAYEIERPDRWEIYPLFLVGLLEPYREDPNGRPQKEIPTPDIEDNEPSYVVSKIVDSRWYGNPKKTFPHQFVQYMVAWEGTVQKRILGNCSRCYKILQCKHCNSSMKGIRLNLKTIG